MEQPPPVTPALSAVILRPLIELPVVPTEFAYLRATVHLGALRRRRVKVMYIRAARLHAKLVARPGHRDGWHTMLRSRQWMHVVDACVAHSLSLFSDSLAGLERCLHSRMRWRP